MFDSVNVVYNQRDFIESHQYCAHKLQIKRAWNILTLKKTFLTKWQGFELIHFPKTAPSK